MIINKYIYFWWEGATTISYMNAYRYINRYFLSFDKRMIGKNVLQKSFNL